jgi:hypothetical protein
MSLKQLLQQHRADILAAFVRDSEREHLPPPGLTRSTLLDDIPVFLDEISEELSKRSARESGDGSEVVATAREHGEQRWTTGYDLEAVVREYGILSHAIFRDRGGSRDATVYRRVRYAREVSESGAVAALPIW